MHIETSWRARALIVTLLLTSQTAFAGEVGFSPWSVARTADAAASVSKSFEGPRIVQGFAPWSTDASGAPVQHVRAATAAELAASTPGTIGFSPWCLR